MSAVFERKGGRRVTWRTIFGLLLVPLVAAGVLLWGLWNPTERLETVTAAVVNLDKPVTVDGQTVPLGRVLAAELIGSPKKAEESSADNGDNRVNFDWVLTDEEDAQAGLDEGRYGTVVTIPENFSNAATSFSRAAAGSSAKNDAGASGATQTASETPEKATIDIQTSDRGRLLDSALSGIVTSTATSVLNEQLGAQFVGGVFVGMTELGDGIAEAADGATQLADGSGKLADGVTQLADGSAQLADGAAELATGTAQLSGGVQQLSGGAASLATGLSDFAGGTADLAAGARDNANGQVALSQGLNQYVGGINSLIDQVLPVGSTLQSEIDKLVAQIEDGEIPFPTPEEKQQALDALAQVKTELTKATDQMQVVRDSGTTIAGGFAATTAGSVQIADGLDGLSGGAGQLAGGAQQLSGGLGQLAANVPDLAIGTSQLAQGARASADGAQQLADGAHQAADGTSSLAEGLHTAANNIPRYTKEQSEELAKVAVQPVEAKGASDELFNAAGVPLFVGIALWAGAFASFLVLAPLWRRTREAARGVGFVTFRSALPVVGLGAAQGAIAGLILPALLGYDFAQGFGFFGMAVLAGVAFALVNQGLTALLGGFGSFLSFALLVVAFAIGVISTAPAPLQAIGDGSPIGALFGGFQAIALGTSGAPQAAFTLVLWALGGLLLTAFAVARARRRPEPRV